MKKKIKKLSKEQVLKNQLAETLNELSATKRDLERTHETISKIEAFFPSDGYGIGSRSSKSIVEKVMEVVLYKRQFEGLILPSYEEVRHQREIIMWLINPKTCDQSKLVEELEKRSGMFR